MLEPFHILLIKSSGSAHHILRLTAIRSRGIISAVPELEVVLWNSGRRNGAFRVITFCRIFLSKRERWRNPRWGDRFRLKEWGPERPLHSTFAWSSGSAEKLKSRGPAGKERKAPSSKIKSFWDRSGGKRGEIWFRKFPLKTQFPRFLICNNHHPHGDKPGRGQGSEIGPEMKAFVLEKYRNRSCEDSWSEKGKSKIEM